MSRQLLLHRNAFELDAGGFDVMITDPPYSAHVHASATSASGRRGTRKREFGFESLTRQARRHVGLWASRAKRWSIVYSDVESSNWLSLAVQAHGIEYVRTMPWVRWSMPQLSGDRPPQGFEHVLVFHPKGRKHWNGPGNLTHLAHLALRGESKHKAEKPLDQALDLVSYFSDLDELVFDPFAGHGTVGLACRLLGRNYVGCEQDAEWAAKASARLVAPLSERDLERVQRWLDADVEPVSALTEGPSVARAESRKRDKDLVRAVLGLPSAPSATSAGAVPVPGPSVEILAAVMEEDHIYHRTVFGDELWDELAPFAHFSSYNRYARLDFLQLPEALRTRALAFESPCVSCKVDIHPLRAREKSGRSRIAGSELEWRLFYAATCPQEINAGCTRTKAAKAHMEWLRGLFPGGT